MKMKVEDSIQINENHSIEWGIGVWENAGFSVRNRYKNQKGGFSTASGHLPWCDFHLIILESIKRKHFSKKELNEVLKEIGNYLENE
jgi:hypothetical protein